MNLPLIPGKYYHLYNHANGSDNLFRTHENYLFFLKKYTEYILPIADTFAYCLMPNHFHLAIRIKSEEELLALETFEVFKTSKVYKELDVSKYITQQFSNFFNAYSKAFNKQHQRRGNLFIHTFKRKYIDSDNYFKQLIHYIHFNPVHHNFVEDLRDWKYSSYESYFSEKSTHIARDEAIRWFGNAQAFYEFHRQEIDGKMVLELEVV